MTDKPAALHDALACLAAIGEESRLRLYALLAEAELAVSELVTILGQSQPRVSRHLKLLLEAGLVERRREGAWAFFHAPEKGAPAAMARAVLARLDHDDKALAADRARLGEVRASRAAQAQKYFAEHAPIWDETRRLHAPGGGGRGGDSGLGAGPRAALAPAARHRLRGRAHAGAARAARRQRPGRGSLRRHARRGAGARRTGRTAQRAIAAGRYLRLAGGPGHHRSRHRPSGSALSRQSRPRLARGRADARAGRALDRGRFCASPLRDAA